MVLGGGGCDGKLGATLYRLLGETRFYACLAPVAHLNQGRPCGQSQHGACRSEGLVAGEHVSPLYRDRYHRNKQRLGKQRGAKVAQVDVARRLAERSGDRRRSQLPSGPSAGTSDRRA